MAEQTIYLMLFIALFFCGFIVYGISRPYKREEQKRKHSLHQPGHPPKNQDWNG